MSVYGGPGVWYWTEPRAEPVIRIAPVNTIGFEGQPVSLDVLATGADPLAYEWSHDDAALALQTNSVVTIPKAALTDAGLYTVTVSNALGSVTSRPVKLGIAKYQALTDGLVQGRPHLSIRNGKAGEKCAIYAANPLAPGDALVVPGTAAGPWQLRDTLTFPTNATNEVEWTDPQALGAGETRFYGVVPVE